MGIAVDIYFVKKILPDHYTVDGGEGPNRIRCKSRIGIPDEYGDKLWAAIFNDIKEVFGKRFSEVFHSTCTNHVDFTIYLKNG